MQRILCEATASYLHLHFDPWEDSCFIADRLAWLKPKQYFGAALRAAMLSQEKDAGLRSLCRSTISEPRRQRYTRDEVRAETSHVKHNCAEAATLQYQVCRS